MTKVGLTKDDDGVVMLDVLDERDGDDLITAITGWKQQLAQRMQDRERVVAVRGAEVPDSGRSSSETARETGATRDPSPHSYPDTADTYTAIYTASPPQTANSGSSSASAESVGHNTFGLPVLTVPSTSRLEAVLCFGGQ